MASAETNELIRRWLDGEPLKDLPEGTEDHVRTFAQRRAYIARGVVQSTEQMHRVAVQRYNSISDQRPSDPRMRNLQHGMTYVYMTTAETLLALRDWVVGRL